MSTLLAIPRELREEILHYLTLPSTVYTSSAKADTHSLHQIGSRKTEETYVDTRIYLPSRPPANVLSTCRQLRQEGLEHHTHLLNSSSVVEIEDSKAEVANSTKVAERSGTEFDEAAERAGDDGVTLRLTLEVQRAQRGPFGFSVPIREELSPRFLALLPLMKTARKLKLVVWPAFDWWNGPPQVSPLEQWRQRKALLKRINAYQVGHTEQPSEAESAKTSDTAQPRLDAVSVAVGKILAQLPAVEELDLGVFIATGDLFRWDLPDVKWEKIQPWLDGPITRTGGVQLRRVSRTLTSVWQMPEVEIASQQPFYVQKETRSDTLSNKWRVERQGGLRAPMFEHLAHLAALELPETSVNETFERVDS
ncbi:hypothetical protein BU25DRAFT_462846 [Macroventuria anomochaeta]|uniref:Uncharacterized protein n=1 Tax=Macroventuria anomochaeta TaxID=301207 RepID=A0ACB6RKT9_9PLEO|nr:uncharacterized protein BU25DRAFT_462846 [Macroventuria anomochaeta]KAF2622526.1 hypothetical protein BU25DRAFT_462846 [Macroventuria anomochaeta]